MPYVVSDGVHCARCKNELHGSQSEAYGSKICSDCAAKFKELSRQVPEWELFNKFYEYANSY